MNLPKKVTNDYRGMSSEDGKDGLSESEATDRISRK